MFKDYLNHGKQIFQLIKNAKTPKHENWQSESMDELDVELTDGNVGWALGADDVVLDIDPRNGGKESYTRLCEDLGIKLTPTVYTAGGGFHVYMTLPEHMIGAKFKKEQEQYRGIDFLTHGRYVVVEGSVVNGKHYRWAGDGFVQSQIPVELADYYRKLSVEEAEAELEELGDLGQFVAGSANGDDEETIRELLTHLNNNMGNHDWVDVGMALHNWHPVEGLRLWAEWSIGGATYKKGETAKRWESFEVGGGITIGTLKHKVKGADFDRVELEVEELLRVIKTASVKQIQLEIAPRVRKNIKIDAVSRNSLATAIKKRIGEVQGGSLAIALAREMVEPPPQELARMNETPDWCKEWIYINLFSMFLYLGNKQEYKSEGFNIACGVHVPVGDNGSKQSATKYVADNGFLRIVGDMMYLPSVDKEFITIDGCSVYNSFNKNTVPMASKNIDSEGRTAIKIMNEHLKFICNNNDEHVSILKQWIAHQIQFMGVKVLWSPVIQSIQGIGKSYIGDLLRACLGRKNVGVVKSDQVSSPYNEWATKVCVNVLEELRVQGHNRHEVANGLKPLITDLNIHINPKFINPYPVINTTNYICFTNFKDALPLEKDDRRWWVIFNETEHVDEISSIFNMPDIEYFTRLYGTLESADQLRRYFLDYDVTDEFKALKRAPHTVYKQLMIDNESSSVNGLDDVKEAIANKVCDYVADDIISSAHLFNYIEEEHQDLHIGTVDKNRILKRLGYMKYNKRVKIEGRMFQLWSKKPLTPADTKAFVARFE